MPVLLALCALGGVVAHCQTPQRVSKEGSNPDSAQGERIFSSTCAACHGLDGRGGERAPNIAGNAKLHRLSDAELSAIVKNGVPGTGMPAFGSLAAAEVQAVVSYLRVLQGRGKAQPVAGDADRGQTIFFGKGECSSCHMMQGQGGFAGPDLSSYGSNRAAKDIRDAILDPANNTDWRHKTATVVARDGSSVSGFVRNEDNFSVQLQSADSTFHFFQKSELRSLEYQDHPVMPTNFAERLSASEMDDLVNYVLSAKRSARPKFRDDE